MLEHTILADWNAWYGRYDCGVNKFLGGGVFVCHRPLSPEGNGCFCECHGQSSGYPIELTWNEWLRHLRAAPKKIGYRLYTAWLDFKVVWREHDSTNPTCTVERCAQQAIYACHDEDKSPLWFCFEHIDCA